MMALVYATLFAAFVLELFKRRRWALCYLFLSLALCVWLFLFEIYSPDYGFRMPWLRFETTPALRGF